MNVPAIKKIVEQYDLKQLRDAEEKLVEGEELPIEIQGEDEGEQLTHILAGIWILEQVENEQMELKDAVRAYTKRVRDSIS